MTDNQTTGNQTRLPSPVPGQIWRTTIAGNLENARQIIAVDDAGVVSFSFRAPPGPPIVVSGAHQKVSNEDWNNWVATHKAAPISEDDMKSPPQGY